MEARAAITAASPPPPAPSSPPPRPPPQPVSPDEAPLGAGGSPSEGGTPNHTLSTPPRTAPQEPTSNEATGEGNGGDAGGNDGGDAAASGSSSYSSWALGSWTSASRARAPSSTSATLPPRRGSLARRSAPLPSAAAGGSRAPHALRDIPPLQRPLPRPAAPPPSRIPSPVLLPESTSEALSRLQRPDAPLRGLLNPALLWITLAHNIAHSEAMCRPVTLISSSGSPQRGDSSDSPYIGRERPASSSPMTGNVQKAGMPPASSSSPHTLGSSGKGADVGTPPAVQLAHWRAMQSLCSLCCAIGAGKRDAPREGASGGAEKTPGGKVATASSEVVEAFLDALSWLCGEDLETVSSSRNNGGDCPSPGQGTVSSGGANGTRVSFGFGRTPLDLSLALLPRYDLPHVQRQVAGFFSAGQSGGGAIGRRPDSLFSGILLRRVLDRWWQLAADPLLLVLELLSLGLSAFGAPPLDLDLDLDPDQVPSSMEDMLSRLVTAIIPMLWWQAAAVWRMQCTGRPVASVGPRGSPPQDSPSSGVTPSDRTGPIPSADTSPARTSSSSSHLEEMIDAVLEVAAESTAESEAAGTLREILATTLVPTLYRLYILRCLLSRHQSAEELAKQYRSLGSAGSRSDPGFGSRSSPIIDFAHSLLHEIHLPLDDLLSPLTSVSYDETTAPQGAARRGLVELLSNRWLDPSALSAFGSKGGARGNSAGLQDNTARQQPSGVMAPPSSPSLPPRPRLIRIPTLFQDLYLEHADKVLTSSVAPQ